MKYIIESNDVIGYTPKYAMLFGDGYMIQPLEDLEKLNCDYINEHYGNLQDEAYQRGLEDAWEAARRVALNSNDGGLSTEDLDEIFDCYTLQQVLKGYTAKQTIAKLKAYEEQKADDEIKVGDEVTAYNELIRKVEHFVVIEVGGYFGEGNVGLFVLYGNDKSSVDFKAGCFSTSAKDVTKTGKHYDIDKILEAMKE